MTQHLYKDGRGFYVTPSVLQLTDPTKMSHQMKQGTTVMFRKFRDELSQTCCTLFIVLHICTSKIYKYKYIRVYLHHFILCNKTLIFALIFVYIILTGCFYKSIVKLYRDHRIWQFSEKLFQNARYALCTIRT